MNCNNCGAPLVPGNQFCVTCGAPVQGGCSPTYAPVRPIGFGEAIRNFFTQYATFSGRATRSEYWYIVLFNMIVNVAISGVIGLILPDIAVILAGSYRLATLIPGLALCWRRLHDIGKSGGWYFIGLIPLVGVIILLVFFCKDSGPDNQYGRRKV